MKGIVIFVNVFLSIIIIFDEFVKYILILAFIKSLSLIFVKKRDYKVFSIVVALGLSD